MERRRYSDEERAGAVAALSANEGNLTRTSEQLGIPISTLEGWAKGTRHPEVSAAAQGKKGPLADHLEEVAHLLIDAMPGKIADATLDKIAIALGIAVDKIRLLRDLPTTITGRDLSDSERAARLRALVEQFRRATDGNGPPLDRAFPALEPPAGAADGGP